MNQLFSENRLFLLFFTHLRKVCYQPYPVLCTKHFNVR